MGSRNRKAARLAAALDRPALHAIRLAQPRESGRTLRDAHGYYMHKRDPDAQDADLIELKDR